MQGLSSRALWHSMPTLFTASPDLWEVGWRISRAWREETIWTMRASNDMSDEANDRHRVGNHLFTACDFRPHSSHAKCTEDIGIWPLPQSLLLIADRPRQSLTQGRLKASWMTFAGPVNPTDVEDHRRRGDTLLDTASAGSREQSRRGGGPATGLRRRLSPELCPAAWPSPDTIHSLPSPSMIEPRRGTRSRASTLSHAQEPP